MTRPGTADAIRSSYEATRRGLKGTVPAVAVALMLMALQPAVLWAAGGAGHGEQHHVPGIGDLLFPVINFSIYLAIVVIYIIPAIRQYLSQRHEQITALVNEAKSALSDAEHDAAAARTRVGKIDAECAALRADILNTATQRGERAGVDAEATGERRLKDAGLLAQQERRRALADVRAEIAALAVRLAEERIRKALGPDDQRAFVQQFLQEAANR